MKNFKELKRKYTPEQMREAQEEFDNLLVGYEPPPPPVIANPKPGR